MHNCGHAHSTRAPPPPPSPLPPRHRRLTSCSSPPPAAAMGGPQPVVELACDAQCDLGESPIWDERNGGRLYFVVSCRRQQGTRVNGLPVECSLNPTMFSDSDISGAEA